MAKYHTEVYPAFTVSSTFRTQFIISPSSIYPVVTSAASDAKYCTKAKRAQIHPDGFGVGRVRENAEFGGVCYCIF